MKPDAHGLLVPDPSAIAKAVPAAGATAAYPLTYVIYALVPTQPLYDTNTCALRTTSQLLLANWLRYVTGTGQTNLPAGMAPLPSALAAQAKADIAQVGAAPVTGTCAKFIHNGGKPPTTTTTTTVPGSPTTIPGGGTAPISSTLGNFGGSSGSGGGSVGSSGSSSGPSVALTNIPSSGKSGNPGPTRPIETIAAIPPFGGHRTAGAFDGALALVGIALITSLAAWITAGGEIGGAGVSAARKAGGGLDVRRVGSLVVLWAAVGLTAVALVLFQLGPMLQQRDQRALLANYRVTVGHAAAAADTPVGLGGNVAPTTAPEVGTPVGIVEIGALKTQAVVIEGVQPSQTSRGPGHVPGTAGLGQPGNSVIVARRNAYGGTFAHLGSLDNGDRIAVTTTQGQSVYEVTSVQHVDISGSTSTPAGGSNEADASTAAGGIQLTRATVAPKHAKVSVASVYGPTPDDRLTLITSGTRAPWDDAQATEVVAKLLDKPYPATPQGTRSTTETGLHGDGSVWPAVVLALLAFGAALAGAVLLYRRMRFRTAYLLTIAPLVALTVITGETVLRLLPAWT